MFIILSGNLVISSYSSAINVNADGQIEVDDTVYMDTSLQAIEVSSVPDDFVPYKYVYSNNTFSLNSMYSAPEVVQTPLTFQEETQQKLDQLHQQIVDGMAGREDNELTLMLGLTDLYTLLLANSNPT